MLDRLILVNDDDQVVGYAKKLAAHKEGKLHRAFSVFAFCRESNTLLLQQRALGKYHSGGLWSNACCSHPRLGEEMIDAMNQRMAVELGLHTGAKGIAPHHSNESDVYHFCGKFKYFAQFDELMEYEVDSVYVYYVTPTQAAALHPSHEEIHRLRWISTKELFMWLDERPQDFSAWFRPAFALAFPVIFADAQRRGVVLPTWPIM
jgi:isopentenyl-diphosphate delta-isomerase type 1